MSITPALIPEILAEIAASLDANAAEISELDLTLGDGDHLFNLQRGLQALQAIDQELANLDWPAAWQKIGMTLMASVGGASGSLYATLFIAIHKNLRDLPASWKNFASAFAAGVEAMKLRGKADIGEKTMLDVLVPVAYQLTKAEAETNDLKQLLERICNVAAAGAESTRDMLATKGRASFLGERSRGHMDAGAKTAQLMISAIAKAIEQHESR